MKKILCVEDVADLLHVSSQTVRNRLSRGDPMPPSFKIGRRRLFVATVVDAWLAQRTDGAPVDAARRGRRRQT